MKAALSFSGDGVLLNHFRQLSRASTRQVVARSPIRNSRVAASKSARPQAMATIGKERAQQRAVLAAVLGAVGTRPTIPVRGVPGVELGVVDAPERASD